MADSLRQVREEMRQGFRPLEDEAQLADVIFRVGNDGNTWPIPKHTAMCGHTLDQDEKFKIPLSAPVRTHPGS